MPSPGQLLFATAKRWTPSPLKRRWHAFQWRYRWLRWLPGTSRQFGPPRRWVRLADYLREHPGTVREVQPAQHLPEPVIHCCNPVPERFFARMQREIPPASVVELPNVRLLGPDGWVVGANDSLILDTSYHSHWDRGMNADGHWILKRRGAPPVRRLPGRTLSLASDFAAGGFAHFVHDSLSRLYLLERAGIDPATFDHIYWPHLPTAGAKQLIEASGVPRHKIIGADPACDLECESLTATTFPGLPAHLTPPYVDFLRHRFAPPPRGSRRRLYLSRAGFTRVFRNAPEIERVLADHDYELCQPHLDPDVLAKCADATHLVSLEGSGFFNAFAAPAGTRSLVILPEAGQTLPYNLMLALSAGHKLFLLVARSLIRPGQDPVVADVMLDPSEFDRALKAMDAPA
jgi:capsular polysaccharide biosynthesis protein